MSEKELYPYQKEAIDNIVGEFDRHPEDVNLLFQLPTGGGKTIIFSEIARQFVEKQKKSVLILTHRIELCRQTSDVLSEVGVRNKVITADVRYIENQEDYDCFTAMVETLNNRLQEDNYFIDDIGLVIVDEAHYNSFRKIFKYFKDVRMLGVTATPLSSNRSLPLKDNYDHLVVGSSISELIEGEYLSRGITYTYDLNLRGLKVGIHGDYTVSSIEYLYSSAMMQQKLLSAYQEVSEGEKTLIFNAGIMTSRAVEQLFKRAGYDVRHLDSTFTKQERQDVLDWFHKTPNAILTSVGILTTGFDEPSVRTILLNRATRSLTLYHQMIGRGSRVWKDKKEFKIIDLGNNARRLGYWDDKINWHEVFLDPDKFLDKQLQIEKGLEEMEFDYEMPPEVAERFPYPAEEDGKPFSIKDLYSDLITTGGRPQEAVEASIENHYKLLQRNARTQDDAMDLMRLLEGEIEYRIEQYKKCVNGTDNYADYLRSTYKRKLNSRVLSGEWEEEEEVLSN